MGKDWCMMSAAGIICEYNPFHEGHQFHIQQVREKTGADTVVALLNGGFVQRGEPAIVDKYIRTRMALEGGADMVFELPVRYGLSSAEDFARGGILALDSLSFVDFYCFGSEGAAVQEKLEQAGRYLSEEPEHYRKQLGCYLREGFSFPAARELAYADCVELTGEEREQLFMPNNTLGIEYIKAALRLGSSMKPVVIRRQGMGYHEELTEQQERQGFLSATAVRGQIWKGNFVGLSEESVDLLKRAPCFLRAEDFWQMCSFAIRDRWDKLEDIKDLSDELANSFRKNWHEALSLDDFANRCKTKNITMARVKRCVFQTLLGIEKESSGEDRLPYIRLLGMRRSAAANLKCVKKTKVLGRLARDMEELDARGREKLLQDIKAADLYRTVAMAVSGQRLSEEFRRQVILVD